MRGFAFAGGLLEKLPSAVGEGGALAFLCHSCCFGLEAASRTQHGAANEKTKFLHRFRGSDFSGLKWASSGRKGAVLDTKPDSFHFSAPDSCWPPCTHTHHRETETILQGQRARACSAWYLVKQGKVPLSI